MAVANANVATMTDSCESLPL